MTDEATLRARHYQKFYSNYDTGTWAVIAVDGKGYIMPDVPVLLDDIPTEQADGAVAAANALLREVSAIVDEARAERDAAWKVAAVLAEALDQWRDSVDGPLHPWAKDALARYRKARP